jgi:hypothetical protein
VGATLTYILAKDAGGAIGFLTIRVREVETVLMQ